MKNRLNLGPLAALALSFAPPMGVPLTAGAENGSPAIINAASADAGLVNLMVDGANFSKVRNLSLRPSGYPVPLPVISRTDATLIALLPPGVEPGSYALSVSGGDKGGNTFHLLPAGVHNIQLMAGTSCAGGATLSSASLTTLAIRP